MPVPCEPCGQRVVKIRSYQTTCGYRTRWGRCDRCLRWYCSRKHEINDREAAWRERIDRFGVRRRVIVCMEGECCDRWWNHQAALDQAREAEYLAHQAHLEEHRRRSAEPAVFGPYDLMAQQYELDHLLDGLTL